MKTKLLALPIFAAALTISHVSGFAQGEESTTTTHVVEANALGRLVYTRRCQECHGASGGGFIGPKLAGNERLANAEFVVRQITKGSADMPAFGKRLTPEELLAVANHVRNSWDNDYGVVSD